VTLNVSDISTEAVDEMAPAPQAAAQFRLVLLVFLLAALLVAGGWLIWLAAHRTGDQSDVQSEREQVMNVSEQFALRVGTYGPEMLDAQGQMPSYRSSVKEMITSKFATSFDQQVSTAEELVKQAGASRKADVYATGVSAIDEDSAEVLLAGAVSSTFKGQDPQEPSPFRWDVSLVKVDGKWLVDNFSPTGAAQ
jgi:Mce-associated membrane protein